MDKRLTQAARAFASLLLFLFMFSMSGCWDATNIEDRCVNTAAVIDKTPEGYAFYAEIVNIHSDAQIAQDGQGGQQKVEGTMILKGTGESLSEARLSLDMQANHELFLGAIQSLIFTEDMARHGIEEYVYRLRQMYEYRKTIDIVVTPDRPEDILSIKPVNAQSVGFAIDDTLRHMVSNGMAFHMSLQELLQELAIKNRCYLLATISGKSGQIVFTGYTVFDGGKSIAFIPYDKAKGIIYVASDWKLKPKFVYEVPVEDNSITLEAKRTNKKIKAVYDAETEDIIFTVEVSFNSVLQYTATNQPVTKKVIKEVEAKLEETIKKEIMESIDTSQNIYGCDYLTFSEYFRISYPDVFDKINWHEAYKKAEFNVNVKVKADVDKSQDYNPRKVE